VSVTTELLPWYKEEPHQNPNKSEKKYSFFIGIFKWLKLGIKNPTDAFLAKIEASAQRFFHDSYSFT